MSRNIKISAALIAVFAAVIAVVAIAAGGGDDKPKASAQTAPNRTNSSEPARASRVVASDPRTLGRTGTGGVTFTEFLDFECESCAALFPVVEQLREQYAGRVTFNIRYFPLDAHPNSRNAAHAVEAAAQQDKLEAMYKRMYETQTEWSHQAASQARVFRQYAQDLGLDMKEFDAAVTSSETASRVERDVQAGLALGVQGTPTLFINEQRIEPQSVEDLRQAIDAALAGS